MPVTVEVVCCGAFSSVSYTTVDSFVSSSCNNNMHCVVSVKGAGLPCGTCSYPPLSVEVHSNSV